VEYLVPVHFYFLFFGFSYSFLPSDKRYLGKTYLAGNIIQRL